MAEGENVMTVICISRREVETGFPVVPGGEWASCVECGQEIYMTPNTVRTQREKRAAGEECDVICYDCVPAEVMAEMLKHPRERALAGALEEAARHLLLLRKLNLEGN